MLKRYRFSQEQIRQLEKLQSQNKNKNVYRRARALLLYASGEKTGKISEQTEFAKTYIWELVAKYRDNGISAIAGDKHGGNHRNMSFEDEEKLLKSFKAAAEAGQIIEVSEIKKAYEEAIGRSLDSSRGQIYRVLERHEWRKLMPRSKHPNKASDEEIESSKKLTTKSVI